MSDPARIDASFPLPPPVFQLTFVDVRTGKLSEVGIEFLTKLWAGIQGHGGIYETYLPKTLADGSIFVGGSDGNAHGVPMSGDATVADTGEVTVSRVRVQMTAGTDLSGHRVVVANASGEAVYPDITVLADGVGIIGITTGAIVTGDVGPVQVIGEMEEPSWAWTPGEQIYCDDGGVLTQSVPSGKFVAVVAVARTATQISIIQRLLVSTP